MATAKIGDTLHPALLDAALLYRVACNMGNIPWSRYDTAMTTSSLIKNVIDEIVANASVMQSFVAGHTTDILTWECPNEVYAFYTLAEVLANHLSQMDIEPVKLPVHVTSYLESVRSCLPQFPHYYSFNPTGRKMLCGKKDINIAMSCLLCLCGQGLCDWSMYSAFSKRETGDVRSRVIQYVKDTVLKEPVYNVLIGTVKKSKINNMVDKILNAIMEDSFHLMTPMTMQKCTAVAMTLFPSSKLLMK